jgi:molecular chaperone DnaJ
MKRDAYEVLGVPRDADERQIKKAFRTKARELHPDVNRHDADAEEKFKELAEAHEILSDAERRQIYDRYGHEGLSSRGFESPFQGFGSFSDIFDAFFGGGDVFGGGAGGGAVQGGDVAVAVEISLADAAIDTQVDVEYDAVDLCGHCRGNGAEPGTPIRTCERCGGDGKIPETPCSVCGGRGRQATRRKLTVDIPAGIADEQRIRLTGRGHAGERGGPPGDLYVLVRVADDERFVRDGNDLVHVLDLAAPSAALGTTATVPTLDGEEELKIPAGTQPGAVFTLRGHGMPSLRRGRRGDQRVLVNVVVPRNLTAEQRQQLERFAETLGPHNLEDEGERESLFSRVRRAFG